jgi:AcrR family transcriptional regulator
MTDEAFARQRPRDFDGTTAAELAVFQATEELLSETSLQELTVAQILERGGLSRANFYHYFANKHQVLVAMTSRLFDQVYGQDAPWDRSPGRGRARTMGASLEHTLRLLSVHGPVICAVVEHMHGEPAVAQAWQPTYRRFQVAVSEQIEHERAAGRAADGPPADMVAAMLICGVERALYVGSRGLDPRLPTVGDAIESLVTLNDIAIYGGRHTPASRDDAPEDNDRVTPEIVEKVARAETAQTILDAMRGLLLTHPLGDLSVAKIIECAAVSRASFYFYFRSRDDAFAVLFTEAADRMVATLAEIAGGSCGDAGQMSTALRNWLDLDEMTTSVIKNAVHEWPRRPELRRHYLAAVANLADHLESIIVTYRERGLAPDGPPAAQYAATLLWMVERTVAGSLAGEAHLEDFQEVKSMLAQLLSTAIHGRR